VVHDSPFVMGLMYHQDNSIIPKDALSTLAVALHNNYNNLNIFLERNDKKHPYQAYGRNQTLEEAIEVDENIKKYLQLNDIPFEVVIMGAGTIDKIVSLVTDVGGREPIGVYEDGDFPSQSVGSLPEGFIPENKR